MFPLKHRWLTGAEYHFMLRHFVLYCKLDKQVVVSKNSHHMKIYSDPESSFFLTS